MNSLLDGGFRGVFGGFLGRNEAKGSQFWGIFWLSLGLIVEAGR